MIEQRLELYFTEATKHIDLIDESLDVLQQILPLQDYEALNQLQRFALNALIFRFSKLQDLIGAKIFRNYLEYTGYNTADKSFFDILKEIEKESVVDIDTWDELRELRNKIAHEYPQELDEMLENINLFIQRASSLIKVAKKLEQKFYETKKQRS